MGRFKKTKEMIFGEKIGNTRIVPVATKTIIFFVLFFLTVNLSTNYLNLSYNRNEQMNLMKKLLIKDLKSLYEFANNQYDIYQFNQKIDQVKNDIIKAAKTDFTYKKSVALGIKPDGSFLFQASNNLPEENIFDPSILKILNEKNNENIEEGFITFKYNKAKYIGVYKFNKKWGVYLVRGENEDEFYSATRKIFITISIIIVIFSLLSAIIGIIILNYLMKYIEKISKEIYKMIKTQDLKLIDLHDAPPDDITFLGMAFNSLASTINNLVSIFKKFANKDIAIKAYKERVVKLEGSKRELTCLFSDIKNFTYRTEVLGTEIINLINLHYDQAIKSIIRYDGVIGSIIGDALLAVFGVLDDAKMNKSYSSVLAGYEIQEIAKHLRDEMEERKKRIIEEKGKMDDFELKIYRAVMIEVGVGIDGGEVFYGNIGSNERMTNTVIGDNVNSASRLEGLTRIYKVPIICSGYIKDDIEKNVPDHDILFIEIDQVRVKGKTIGKKLYWPILNRYFNDDLRKQIEIFQKGLELYYKGDWSLAKEHFKKCNLPLKDIFILRIENTQKPEGWDGIWTMKTK